MDAQRREEQLEKWHEQQIRQHQLVAFQRLYWQFLVFVIAYTIIIVEISK